MFVKIARAGGSSGLLFALALSLAPFFAPGDALAREGAKAGVVTHLSGTLSAGGGDKPGRVMAVGSAFHEGETLSTESGTYARVRFTDAGEIVLRPGTVLRIDSYAYEESRPEADSFVVSMLKGGLRAVTGLVGKRSRSSVKYTATTSTIGIRGTHFGALLCANDCSGADKVVLPDGSEPANGLHVDVSSGAVEVSNESGALLIPAGGFGFSQGPGFAPVAVEAGRAARVGIPDSIARDKATPGIGRAGAKECKVE